MSICDNPEIVRNDWPCAAVPVNIMSGFKATGIFPFDRTNFTETDFASSPLTNCPEGSRESRADI